MQGVLVTEWTEFDNLELKAIDPPPGPGPNEVRIGIRAAGVSFATSLVVAGRYQRKPPLPFVPGTEVAGTILEAGANVTRFQPGDRVCAALDWGAMAEQAVTPDATVFKLPDAIPYHEGIGLTNSYMTSLAGLTWPHLLNVKAGETLLVHGAAGGVGLAAVEIGKILGATVIGTAGSADKLDIVREAGADHVINYREQNFRDVTLELTNGQGVDAVYDPVGGDVFDLSLRCIAPEGRIAPIGFAAGRIPSVPANILLVKNITVCGLNMGYYYGWSPKDVRYEYTETLQSMMAQLGAWYEAGTITLRTSHRFALADFKQAMEVVLGRSSIGRVALDIGSD
ncbi:MAG: NADPH:quinone oxidoreductase family protein [Pseudomonadota bacterium]